MEKFLFSVLIASFVVAASSESSLKETFSKYKFHFKTGDTGEHTRTEESDESGRVIGMYSYKDPNGVLRTIRYNADPELGYQAYGEGFPQFGNAPFSEYYGSVSPTNLPVENVSPTNLSFAGISPTNLPVANVRPANLSFASISSTNLPVANISPTNLPVANVSPTNLSVALLNIEDKSNETISGEASEVSTATQTPVAPKSLSEIESESSVEMLESSTEPSTISPDVSNNRLVPVLLPYGSFHKILIHSGHLYYPVPHALAYSMMAPNYQMLL